MTAPRSPRGADLAAISPEDVERARLAWRRDAKGTGLERLLDAVSADDARADRGARG